MINRRHMLATGLSALTGGAAFGDGYCSNFNYQGVRTCQVGLPIGPVPTARQECQNWCWAACIEAIFQLNGYRVDQEVIVEKVYGSRQACQTATGYQIASAVTGNWISADGTYFSAQADVLTDLSMGYARPDALAQAWRALESNTALINGAVGHATILTAMSYLEDVRGRTQLTGLTVRDPWPYSPNRRQLRADEVAGTFFLCRVLVS